eukprot:TRINITY_DN28361_c1_g1_i2.p1 TRINITY_DN28361_c1_g1~~TRINITY_DN28361_c1_g1_i2.p1  ORF type:complete len:121 (-),score=18.88 TRINITY_DN28361_c1_g1_i2:222-584(-)
MRKMICTCSSTVPWLSNSGIGCLSLCGVTLIPPLSASTIWQSIAKDRVVPGRKCASAIFFHAISGLWTLRNYSKHNCQQPSLKKAKSLFQVRLQNLVALVSGMASSLTPHPILVLLGVIS